MRYIKFRQGVSTTEDKWYSKYNKDTQGRYGVLPCS